MAALPGARDRPACYLRSCMHSSPGWRRPWLPRPAAGRHDSAPDVALPRLCSGARPEAHLVRGSLKLAEGVAVLQRAGAACRVCTPHTCSGQSDTAAEYGQPAGPWRACALRGRCRGGRRGHQRGCARGRRPGGGLSGHGLLAAGGRHRACLAEDAGHTGHEARGEGVWRRPRRRLAGFHGRRRAKVVVEPELLKLCVGRDGQACVIQALLLGHALGKPPGWQLELPAGAGRRCPGRAGDLA